MSNDSDDPDNIAAMAEKRTAFAIPESLATDEELIASVSRGDMEAFECLVSRYQKSALRAAQRFLGDAVEAEDLAQEAFLQIYHQAHRYRAERAAFKTWFFTVLLNLCRNAVKKKRLVYSDNLPDSPSDRDTPSSLLARQEQQRALAEAILNLPPNQRSAFILCHYENFSYAEAAQSLGVSVKAVESLLVRAKRNLREELNQYRER
ncbi:MAG TPA: sigma-70 family RNA polymerase sigma factor [Blastocatellia bacterium]|nr:sigma-70 family RNA polymerase sigma factor [Blastocatellia bacterium]HMV82788.1 sigma-70 family RNA polymerase sigma factor [Blastocatellia bacterium]HMZ23065.1 sigma-70 family RNA polymerase sigma factor [Blastocatellia bacterium]HNG32717.1 sigma-70 family RNA polymerase sigma factor [Blastocatellia bacterium]